MMKDVKSNKLERLLEKKCLHSSYSTALVPYVSDLILISRNRAVMFYSFTIKII